MRKRYYVNLATGRVYYDLSTDALHLAEFVSFKDQREANKISDFIQLMNDVIDAECGIISRQEYLEKLFKGE